MFIVKRRELIFGNSSFLRCIIWTLFCYLKPISYYVTYKVILKYKVQFESLNQNYISFLFHSNCCADVYLENYSNLFFHSVYFLFCPCRPYFGFYWFDVVSLLVQLSIITIIFARHYFLYLCFFILFPFFERFA